MAAWSVAAAPAGAGVRAVGLADDQQDHSHPETLTAQAPPSAVAMIGANRRRRVMSGNPRDDFESLARRYWAALGDALRNAVPGPGGVPGMGGIPGIGGIQGMGGMPGMGGPQVVPPGAEAWQESLDWWTRLAHGDHTGTNDALAHFNSQARQWYARMQEVAARFSGQESSAADVARAWKEALGAAGGNPFPEMLRTLRGNGLQGLEQWMEDASPWLDSLRDEGLSWLRMPAFGADREKQERAQALAAHVAEYQQASNAYSALMLKAQQEAFAIFESKLIEREEPGRQLQTARALFDLWIDAAEEAYAVIALSPEFREVYGRLVNAQMRVRAGVQRMVEEACAQWGMPTRSELDGAHRKLAQLEREVRKLRDAVAQGQGSGAPAGTVKQAARSAASPVVKRAADSVVRSAATPVAKRAAKRTKPKVGKRPAAAAPAKGAKKASRSSAGSFGGAIAGAVPRAPEPIGSKPESKSTATVSKKAAKKAVKKAEKKAAKKAAKKSAKKVARKTVTGTAKKGKR
ncbi:class III poly(R)-hydroxyalkanoic acid synthase subunit PhaE [Luteimonas sp. A537]